MKDSLQITPEALKKHIESLKDMIEYHVRCSVKYQNDIDQLRNMLEELLKKGKTQE